MSYGDVQPVRPHVMVEQIDPPALAEPREQLAHLVPPDRRQRVGVIALRLLVLRQAPLEAVGLGPRSTVCSLAYAARVAPADTSRPPRPGPTARASCSALLSACGSRSAPASPDRRTLSPAAAAAAATRWRRGPRRRCGTAPAAAASAATSHGGRSTLPLSSTSSTVRPATHSAIAVSRRGPTSRRPRSAWTT